VKSVEVLVVGGGPAGLVAALNLAPLRSVVVVERLAEAPDRIGESLAPAARRLFADMGLLERFEAEGHARRHAHRVIWGNDRAVDVDLIRDLDGAGWTIERARFENWLRGVATLRGAVIRAPAKVIRLERGAGAWRASIVVDGREVEFAADFLIDATGRGASFARMFGARRRVADRLVCSWAHGVVEREVAAGTAFLQAAREGWWYSAPLPRGRRVVAFHTDADLPQSRDARTPQAMVEAARRAGEIGALLDESGFRATRSGFTAANSSVLDAVAGEGWAAVGDAAIAFDPLSARGLFNALFTGLAAAEAVDRLLAGDRDAFSGYAAVIAEVAAAYRRELALWYAQEKRWASHPFWRRRLVQETPAA